MKNNILFGLSTVIIAVSVSYYYCVYLPKSLDDYNLFQKMQNCASAGNKYMQEEDKDKHFIEGNLIGTVGKQKFTYSKKLNTCLYASYLSVFSSDFDRYDNLIIDLNTNTIIADIVHCDKKSCPDESSIDDKNAYDKLYAENFPPSK